MTQRTYRAAVAALVMATALILSVIPALDHAATASASGKPPGSVIMHPPHAFAAPDVALAMCESSAPSLCVEDVSGTEFLSSFSNATLIKFNPNGNTFTFGGVTYDTGTLNEPSQSPACLGINGINNINRQNCSTGSGIIWGEGFSNNHFVWISRLKTQENGVLTVFAGSGSSGTVAFTATYPPASGVFERWGFA